MDLEVPLFDIVNDRNRPAAPGVSPHAQSAASPVYVRRHPVNR
jgi:hypothetical protein